METNHKPKAVARNEAISCEELRGTKQSKQNHKTKSLVSEANIIHEPENIGVITLEEFMAKDYESYEFVERELRLTQKTHRKRKAMEVNPLIFTNFR